METEEPEKDQIQEGEKQLFTPPENINNPENPEELPPENPQPDVEIPSEKKEIQENPPEKIQENPPEKIDEDISSTYILKYNRKPDEPRESSYDKELIKSENCLYMIDFKIINSEKEKFLLIYCHEIAAIYFDEIYEKKYSITDLYNENKYFKIFDDVEEVKNIIDDILKHNTKNTKKIYIEFKNLVFRLHIRLIFFDKESEIVFNVPQKNLTDDEKINILPSFLKEIQIKMTHLEDENKKIKVDNRLINSNMNIDVDKYENLNTYNMMGNENEYENSSDKKVNNSSNISEEAVVTKQKKFKNKEARKKK